MHGQEVSPTLQIACTCPHPETDDLNSMGWMEMRTILAKVYWSFDLELVDKDLDWHAQSEMHTLWKKPNLMVRLKKRHYGEKV